MPEARGRLPKGCRMFQRPRDLSAPLSASQHSLRPQQFRQCQGHNRRARVHVTCELSGEGGLAAPLSLTRFGCAGGAGVGGGGGDLGYWTCLCLLACWQRSMLPCAGRQQTARGLVTMPMLLALELYHSMLSSTVVINDYDLLSFLEKRAIPTLGLCCCCCCC